MFLYVIWLNNTFNKDINNIELVILLNCKEIHWTTQALRGKRKSFMSGEVEAKFFTLLC